MKVEGLATVFATSSRPPGRAIKTGPEEEETKSRRVRIVLVDDHQIVLDGLAGLLSRDRRIRIVGQATSGQEAVQLVKEELPDVVLMDIVMPGINGIEATRMIKAEFPQIAVIGLSMLADEDTRQAMLRAGACAHLGKDADFPLLLATLFGCSQ